MPFTSCNDRATPGEREYLLQELRLQLFETEAGMMYAYELGDMEAYLYNAGVADGQRSMIANLLGDISILKYLR